MPWDFYPSLIRLAGVKPWHGSREPYALLGQIGKLGLDLLGDVPGQSRRVRIAYLSASLTARTPTNWLDA